MGNQISCDTVYFSLFLTCAGEQHTVIMKLPAKLSVMVDNTQQSQHWVLVLVKSTAHQYMSQEPTILGKHTLLLYVMHNLKCQHFGEVQSRTILRSSVMSILLLWPPPIKFDHGSTSWVSCLFDCCSIVYGCRN